MYFHVIKINRSKRGPEVSFDDIIIFGSVEVIIFDTLIKFKISFSAHKRSLLQKHLSKTFLILFSFSRETSFYYYDKKYHSNRFLLTHIVLIYQE